MAVAQSSLFGQYKFNWVGRSRREEDTNLVGVEFRGVGKREVKYDQNILHAIIK